jgi:hypothetical protein
MYLWDITIERGMKNESRQSGKVLPQISSIQFVTYFYITEKHLNSGSAIVLKRLIRISFIIGVFP